VEIRHCLKTLVGIGKLCSSLGNSKELVVNECIMGLWCSCVRDLGSLYMDKDVKTRANNSSGPSKVTYILNQKLSHLPTFAQAYDHTPYCTARVGHPTR
jgi:hypothetical protein